MTYIKDYKLKLKKQVKDKKIVIYFKAHKDLRDLLNRAVIREYIDYSLPGGQTIQRSKIKRPVFNNLQMGSSMLLFCQYAVESNWDCNFIFDNAQNAANFLREVPDTVSIIASVFEKYDKVI